MSQRGTLFVSDLHLDPAWPRITQRFLDVLSRQAREADALYVLGDLFEAWVGDDDLSDHNLSVIHALKSLSDSGIPVTMMHGNRDFLLGDAFAELTGCQIESTPLPINLHGEKTLLMHGDELCLGDESYIHFRQQVRSPDWQAEFLAKPLAERKAIAQGLREQSESDKRVKSDDLMDVTPAEVVRLFETKGVNRIIHGHTHRPADHEVLTRFGTGLRHVLSDWSEDAGELFWVSPDGVERETV
ncbi:MAG: UDP-2,3-diacylglucosamine diphosphatase [Gammaproteobacteria bacterium]